MPVLSDDPTDTYVAGLLEAITDRDRRIAALVDQVAELRAMLREAGR